MSSSPLLDQCKGHRLFSLCGPNLRSFAICSIFGCSCHVRETRDDIHMTERQSRNDTGIFLSLGRFFSPFCPLLVRANKGPKGLVVFQVHTTHRVAQSWWLADEGHTSSIPGYFVGPKI